MIVQSVLQLILMFAQECNKYGMHQSVHVCKATRLIRRGDACAFEFLPGPFGRVPAGDPKRNTACRITLQLKIWCLGVALAL